jgi:micrococcal nuclease
VDAVRTAAGRLPEPAPETVAAGVLRTVRRVVDGDTLVLDGDERVRLIGVDTPESVDPRRPIQWYGKEAAAYARSLLQGRRVRLEPDAEPRDRYGRTLAYLHLEDGTFVNQRLVEEGYAFAYRHPPNVKYADLLREAERRAREAGKGLWSDPAKAKSLAPSRR